MTAILESISRSSLLLDIVGVMGLAMLALAAIRLARREQSWGGNMMAWGAVSLLIARVILVATPFIFTRENLPHMGPVILSAQIAIPSILLSFGLGGVVWGLWGHARWLNDAR
ncbi:MAG: hypothetical protein QM755_06980 [Luteolibacter sp.]